MEAEGGLGRRGEREAGVPHADRAVPVTHAQTGVALCKVPQSGANVVLGPLIEFEDLIEATKAEQCQCLVHGIVRQLAEVATGLGGGGALAIVGRGEEQHVQVVDGAVGEPLPVPRLAVRLQGLDVGADRSVPHAHLVPGV